MNEIELKVRDAVRELFAAGKVDVVVGCEVGTIPLTSRPCFVHNAEQADRLVWNSHCGNNLAVYLPRLFERPARAKEAYTPPRVGIVAKGCDIRSIVGLVKENQAPRENLVIVAAACRGVTDSAKLEALLDGDVVVGCEEDSEGTFHVTTRSGETKSVARDQIIADACLDCRHPMPDGADIVIEGEPRQSDREQYASVREFEAMPPERRWRYFADEISKCIRCYACRQACPNCYCKVCFIDQTKPRWAGAGDGLSDVMLYHIGRIFHQAGRCVECDACVRACPMGIDLRTFTQKLASDVKELFDYVPGLSAEDLPPLCTFGQDDNESFITEP